MSEDQPKTEQTIGELYYARDLFVQLFKDDSPLVNLGYTAKQIAITRPVLRHLEEEGRLDPSERSAYFARDITDIGDLINRYRKGELNPSEREYLFSRKGNDESVYLYLLSNGGCHLIGSRGDIPGLSLSSDSESILKAIEHEKSLRFFEDESAESVAIINMIPSANGYDDLTELVKGLYEGTYDHDTSLEKSNIVSNLRSRVSPKAAIFRAAWVDEATKLELAIETNYTSKAIYSDAYGIGEREYHIWRRLPTQELQGKEWIPFGRKPNIPNKKIREILRVRQNQVSVTLVPQAVKA